MAKFTARSGGVVTSPTLQVPCVFGRSGLVAAADKREGDGATPIGVWPLRRVLYRADRVQAPETALPATPIEVDDGWCDAPGDPAYNRQVTHPYPASAEELWRDDGLYDIIVVLGHNDDPVVDGAGSAIFWHCMAEDGRPTEGCIAVPRDDLAALLAQAEPGDAIEVVAD
jgi:L,D-peptidoglycan transpeptidase YkuD (ErfK/YbiS/YcfS/YnhG family)